MVALIVVFKLITASLFRRFVCYDLYSVYLATTVRLKSAFSAKRKSAVSAVKKWKTKLTLIVGFFIAVSCIIIALLIESVGDAVREKPMS